MSYVVYTIGAGQEELNDREEHEATVSKFRRSIYADKGTH